MPVFLTGGRAGRGRNEPLGAGVLRPADRRRLARAAALHDEDLPAARPASGRSAHPSCRTAPASPRRSSTSCCTSSTTSAHCDAPSASIVLYLPKIQTAEEAALWNDMLDALEAHARSAAGHHQGVRAGRAARGLLSADGDPRRARPAFRRLQHRALGLHQQRRRRAGVGSQRSSTRTSTRSR